MRTTLTLDDDLAMMLKREAEAAHRPFRDVVNDAIRRGLLVEAGPRAAIEVPVFDLGYGPGMERSPWDVLADEDAARHRELSGAPRAGDEQR